MNSISKKIIGYYYSKIAHGLVHDSTRKKSRKIRESLIEIRKTRIYNEIYREISDLYNTAVNSIYNGFKNVSDE